MNWFYFPSSLKNIHSCLCNFCQQRFQPSFSAFDMRVQECQHRSWVKVQWCKDIFILRKSIKFTDFFVNLVNSWLDANSNLKFFYAFSKTNWGYVACDKQSIMKFSGFISDTSWFRVCELIVCGILIDVCVTT